MAGDLLVVFAFQALVPAVRHSALFGHVLVVAYYTCLGGRGTGLTVGGIAAVLTALARFLSPPGERLDVLAFALFVAALVAITLLIEWATTEQRLAIARLRALDQIKSALLQGVSHELRTPLTAILGLAETLNRADAPEHERRELTARLAGSAKRLDRLLGDLLDLDRLSRGVIEPRMQRAEIEGVVRSAIRDVDPHDHPVTVDCEVATAEVDVPRLERIVENLVVNAVRHTPPGTPIWIRARSEGEALLLAVEDAGPGVPDHLKTEVFEPFRRGEAGPRGSGIGLTLVARLAEFQGGRAWVEDRPGGGASFRVLLPGALPTSRATEVGGRSDLGPE
ncbi:MAG: hypothetical protein HY775_10170 [Acidobacteria bacterium]|nr:hypothetical protein [Acidobacteriota bacterium]